VPGVWSFLRGNSSLVMTRQAAKCPSNSPLTMQARVAGEQSTNLPDVPQCAHCPFEQPAHNSTQPDISQDSGPTNQRQSANAQAHHLHHFLSSAATLHSMFI